MRSTANTAESRRVPLPQTVRRECGRPGLAPLELVLALPLMLFVMALIINFGTVASWKARTQAAGRYAAWRSLDGRTGQLDPTPSNLPPQAGIAPAGAAALTSPNQVWNGSAEITTSTVRGPAITDPMTGETILVVRQLEATDGMHNGRAELSLRLPLLKGILAGGGSYSFNLEHPLLDHRWEYHDLGYGSNRSRRAKLWYRLDPYSLPGLQQGFADLRQALAELVANPSAADLDPLDRDDEFIMYRGSAPDFHPRVYGCENDLALVRASLIDGRGGLIDQVDRLPGTMARAFIGLYQSQIQQLEAIDPQTPAIEAQIEELEEKIEQLQQFLGSLPMENR